MKIYDNVSPLAFRYYVGEKELFARLKPYVSEGAYIGYQLKVEVALVKVMAKMGICSQAETKEIEKACTEVKPEEVYAEEEKTHHNVRALVNCIRSRLSDRAKPFVHLFVTSADITDTATAIRFKDLVGKVLIPDLLRLERLLIKIAMKEKNTIQIGRTHGQHAEPITFGFALAGYVDRLGQRIEYIKEAARKLCGKLSGAVGAYNTLSLISNNYRFIPQVFEKEVLSELGLRAPTHSTQIVQPEYVTDLVYSVISCFSVLANLADDIRHLRRPEIGEIIEKPETEKIGSSTMPHKVNPWNFEHVKSLWKEFTPRFITVLMDQISEHQRDLTNSASSRFIPEIFTAFAHSINRLASALGKIEIDRDSMRKNLNLSKHLIIAEPLYVLLSLNGHPSGYDYVRKLLQKSRQNGRKLNEIIWEDEQIRPFLDKIDEEQKEILNNPEKYIGSSVQRTEEICSFWEGALLL